jgi:RHS repeat-associated protein
LSIPGISRKTSAGVPRYDDAQDVFLLSGAEDLVPVPGGPPGATRYRPRTEGLFARIDHYRDAANDYWEVWSKDGLVSVYGTPGLAGHDLATLCDPADRTCVFAWNLTRTTDPFGNRIEYTYQRDAVQADGPHYWDQLYLTQVRYVDYGDAANPQFLVTVNLVYESRPDSFSAYRAGFEIRTVQRCTRIEIATHADADRLTRTYHLDYLDERVPGPQPLPPNRISLLSQVRVEGHDGDRSEILPPLEFGYTPFEPEKRRFSPVTGPDLPADSLAHPEYDLVGLFGNGLPDILEMDGTVRYWRNLGAGRFDRPRPMREAPAGLHLADPGVQLLDADGDGRLDLLVTADELAGYYSLRFDGLWDRRSFHRYRQAPSFDLKDPEVTLVDLDGDGVTDAIRSGSRLECFFNDPQQGWTTTRQVERAALADFPNVTFSDPRVRWADMTGDGLQDIVLVYDGSIQYWPALGRGNWGRCVTMANSPRFPYGYDPGRILLGDLDGDGLADLVYVEDTKVTLWINQGGNRWSDPVVIRGTPPVSDGDAACLADLNGTGMSGILWSADAPAAGRPPLFFLDLIGGTKPYLLDEMDNHMGALTRVGYASSTQFYLEDEKQPETRWQTPLPFPVQVVARVEVIDALSGGKLTTEYTYHHGYWDGTEHEFRGFSRVDQRDTEVFEDFHSPGLHGDRPFEPVAAKAFSPPLETRTWFHHGPVGDELGDWHETDFGTEFWPGDPSGLARPQAMVDLLNTLPRRARRDALRALRGMVLRTELFCRDGTERQDRPSTVTEYLYGVREEAPPSPAEEKRLHLFFPHLLGRRTTQWERGQDPMTQFAFSDDYDAYGQARSQVSIAVPRGRDFRTAVGPGQPYLATQACLTFAQRDDEHRYLVNRVARTTVYEILNDGSPSLSALRAAIQDGSAARRLIGQAIEFYDGPAFQGLPFAQVGDYGVSVRKECLILTDELLHEAYRSGDAVQTPAELPPYLDPTGALGWTTDYPQEFRDRLPPLGGYTYQRGDAASPFASGYFISTERRAFDFQENPTGRGRGLVKSQRDALGRDTTLAYDAYQLLATLVTDPGGLTTQVAYDYRVLQPQEVTGATGNRTRYAFTALGHLESTAALGKPGESVGDTPATPGTRLVYDFSAFASRGQPASVRTIQRVHHANDTDVPLPERDETIEAVEYSDGFGRSLQTRAQADSVRFGDAIFGDAVLPAQQSLPAGDAVGSSLAAGAPPPVLVSGWRVYDNKGRIVEQYEPFFASGWEYNPPTDVQRGQKVTRYYDPRGQVIRTVHPDGSEERVLYGVPANLTDPDHFTPTCWEAYTYDVNDNAGRTHPDRSLLYQDHWNTPASSVVDALGRPVEAVVRNGPNPATDWYTTRSTYDIRGNLLAVTDALSRIAARQVYDLASRSLRSEHLDTGVRRSILDAAGNLVEQRDSKGALLLHAHDVLDRPIRLWARDKADQPVTLCERTVYADSPDAGLSLAEATAANLLGHIYQHYDEAGLVTFVAYDFKDNLVEKVQQVIADSVVLRQFDPPPPSWQVQPFRVDWQPPSTIALDSYARGLLDPTEYRTSATYDGLNRTRTVRSPAGVDGLRKEVRLLYNQAGGLTGVEVDGTEFVQSIAQNARGQRTLIAYGNGVMTRYAYDPQTARLLRMRSESFSSPASFTYHPMGDPLQDAAFEYDLVGNILRIQERTPQGGIPNTALGPDALDRTFSYDPVYRLVSATGRECDISPPDPWDGAPRCSDLTRTRGYTERYQYDLVGNLAQLQHQANGGTFRRQTTLVPQSNRLATLTVGASVYDYDYDPNGNLIREGGSRLFEWDYCDQMRTFRTQVGSAEPSVYAHYSYAANGQRVKKLVRKQGGRIEVTVSIDGWFEHHRLVQAGAVQENNTLHVVDDQQRVAVVRIGDALSGDPTPAVQYHLGDHLGSSNLVLDATGKWVDREEYTPYGETSFGSYASKRYRYTGKERDEESGLYAHGMRCYAPWLARWLSGDPAGMVDGPNLYCYARDNPLRLRDPTGMQAQPLCKTTVVEASQATGEQRSFEALQPCTGSSLPSGGSGGTGSSSAEEGAGGSSASGSGGGGSSSSGSGERSFLSKGGGTLLFSLAFIGLGALVLLSGPLGWFGAASAGMLMGSGFAGALVGGAQLINSSRRTAGEDARLNESMTTGLIMASSPGSLAGGLIGLGITGNTKGLRNGAVIGGLVEGVAALARIPFGVLKALRTGSMAGKALRFADALPGGAEGVTHKFGNIVAVIEPGTHTVEQVLRHEFVHSVLSPARGEFLANARASFAMWTYNHSAFLKVLEEGFAESYGLRNLARGFNYPITAGYATQLRFTMETAIGGFGVGAGYMIGIPALGRQLRKLFLE